MISVAPVGGLFVLNSYGEPCGPRLRKSEPWPLRAERPFDYDTKAEALIAAAELQKYLMDHLKKR